MSPLSDRIAGFSPIFEKDQNQFIFLDLSLLCETSLDAKELGKKAVEILGPLFGCVFTGRVHLIPEKDFRYAPATFNVNLACVEGPVWSQTFRNTMQKLN